MILSSIALIGLILIQNPKGTAVAITNKVGAKEGNSFIAKSTWVLSIGIFGMAMILGAV